MSRITLISPGHVSTCPRMLKAAESLAADGHEVHWVNGNCLEWGALCDVALLTRLRIQCTVVDYSRATGNSLRIRAGVRHRVSRALGKIVGPRHLPNVVLGCATTRILPELVHAAAATPSDLVYGGACSLIATMLAAKRLNVPYAIDLEDFHGGSVRRRSLKASFPINWHKLRKRSCLEKRLS